MNIAGEVGWVTRTFPCTWSVLVRPRDLTCRARIPQKRLRFACFSLSLRQKKETGRRDALIYLLSKRERIFWGVRAQRLLRIWVTAQLSNKTSAVLGGSLEPKNKLKNIRGDRRLLPYCHYPHTSARSTTLLILLILSCTLSLPLLQIPDLSTCIIMYNTCNSSSTRETILFGVSILSVSFARPEACLCVFFLLTFVELLCLVGNNVCMYVMHVLRFVLHTQTHNLGEFSHWCMHINLDAYKY